MALMFFTLLLAVACMVSLARWRIGPYLMILVCALQDPIRKMTPGAPGILVLSSAAVWAFTMLGAVLAGDINWGAFRRIYPRLSAAMAIFAVLLIPATVRSATYSPGSWQITLIGLFSYASLMLGILAGTAYPRDIRDIPRLLAWYCLVMALANVGGLLERFGLGAGHLAIGTQAMGFHWITYRMGGALRMMAGFFRSPDVYGWHAATLVMLATTLALSSWRGQRLLWGVLAAWGGVGVMLCARRKMMAMLPVFAILILFLHFRHGQGKHLGKMIALLMAASVAGVSLYRYAAPDPQVEAFYRTTIDSADERVIADGLSSVITTYRQAGFFGYGVGMASQGTQHIQADRPRAWQEGGPGKLMAELGVPGTLGFMFLLFVLTQAMLENLHAVARSSLYPVYAGLSSVLLANGAAGTVSAQIFGDPFVAAFLSFLFGLLLSSRLLRVSSLRPLPARPPGPPPKPHHLPSPDEAHGAHA